MKFTPTLLAQAKTKKDIIKITAANNIPISKALKRLKYEAELRELQSEFVNLQKWIAEKNMQVAVIFEGRDAAGKGGAIKRFKEHLNPRTARGVALSQPLLNKFNGILEGTLKYYQTQVKSFFMAEAGIIVQWLSL